MCRRGLSRSQQLQAAGRLAREARRQDERPPRRPERRQDRLTDLSDAIMLWVRLFTPDRPLAPPFSERGADPTGDDLMCAAFDPCTERSGSFAIQREASQYSVKRTEVSRNVLLPPVECLEGAMGRNR